MASITEETNENVDYLEVDTAIPGQNFVCLSFLSPENVLQRKDKWIMKSFLKSHENEDGNVVLKSEEFDSKFEDYIAIHAEKLDADFAKENNFQTSVRGVKIRGVYSTQAEANKRASELQRLDRNFNIFVGQVGYWLPFDAQPSDVDESEYLEKDLNELMKNYQQNQVKKDLFYADQVESQKRAAAEAVEKQKKENAENDGVEEVKEE